MCVQVRSPKRKLNSDGEDAEEEDEDEDEEEEEEDEEDRQEGIPSQERTGTSYPQPLKKLKVSVLKTHRCAVCSFTTTELPLFRKHLPSHKTDGSSHQCSECGLCYTSRHSLARHLFIVHKMKEPPSSEQQENAPNVPDTQCRVCGKTFDTEPALNTHMRTHGMAFIKSKRQSAANK